MLSSFIRILHVGRHFQLLDDVFGLFGSRDLNVVVDLREGKLTCTY